MAELAIPASPPRGLRYAADRTPNRAPPEARTWLSRGNAGTAVSPMVTSQVVEWTDMKSVLMFSSACHALLFMLTGTALLLSRQTLSR